MTIRTQSCDARYSGVSSWLSMLEVRIAPHGGQDGDVRVVVLDHGPFLQEQVHQLEAGRLAGVVDVLLVGHAQQEDPAPLDAACRGR